MLKKLLALFKGETKNVAPNAQPRGRVDRPINEASLDLDALKIVRRLSRFDHEAYLVGGCVRDVLLDRNPKDYDIGTSATPRQIKRLFRNSRIIGRRFKLAHVYFRGGKIIEVATFRAPEQNDDASSTSTGADILIKDDNVFGSVEDDAVRRDFTINALFYDVNQRQVLDHIGGLDDLDHRLIRAIGDPHIRFREDPIRILRAIKFAARLGFDIEPKTKKALLETRDDLPKAAEPRILEEIYRFCRGGAAKESYELLRETGVFKVILPDLAKRYRSQPESWDLCLSYLQGLDRRVASGQEVLGGEVLTALVLPLLAPTLGWKAGMEPVRGSSVRERVDEILQPSARSLRIARRDQEYCRQLCMMLSRMMPARRMRRASRKSLIQRECFASSIWILKASAESFGEAFENAAQFWNREANRARENGELRPRSPKRKSRRGTRPRKAAATPSARPSRSRRSTASKVQVANSPDQNKIQSRRSSPPPQNAKGSNSKEATPDQGQWDDQSFFAALPKVPELKNDGELDRYGAEELTTERANPAKQDTAEPNKES